jgi:hypothetical protein
MHSRHAFSARLSQSDSIVTPRRLRSTLWLALVATAAAVAEPARAQVDTVPVRPDPLASPITPKRAFLYSLIVPGSAQNKLGRHRVAVGIMAVEMMSLAMMRESAADLREARQQRGDSIVVSYVDANGTVLTTPQLERRIFADAEISSRKSHVEDWIALLVANHLFAAADAFVAASLWDVAARVGVGARPGRLVLTGRITW